MSARAVFKQDDATRALRAAVKAGLRPTGYCIAPDGSIRVDLGNGSIGVVAESDLDSRLDEYGRA